MNQRTNVHLLTRVESLENRIVPAYAATFVAGVGSFIGDAADDTLTIAEEAGFLRHNRFTAGDPGFVSDFDWDSSDAVETKFDPLTAVSVSIDTGTGKDAVVLGSATSPAAKLVVPITVTNQGTDGDTLVVDDSATATDVVATFANAFIGGPGINVTRAGDIFDGGVTFRTGSGGDLIGVEKTDATEPGFIESGAGDDLLVFSDNATLGQGDLTGGEGNDTVDYTAYTSPVVVNLGADSLFGGPLTGAQELPPAATTATGSAFLLYRPDGTDKFFDINISTTGLLQVDITKSQILAGLPGTNGPSIFDLGDGGIWNNSGANLSRVLAGLPGAQFPAANEADLLNGNTYVNVFTTAFPEGELRAQLNPVAFPTSATGVNILAGFEAATGGTGDDILVGNEFANTIAGGDGSDLILGRAGDDVLTGGLGGDTLIGSTGKDTVGGGAADDLLQWNNGDGSDVFNGDEGNDSVQVNGAPAGDAFALAPNGDRAAFQRTNLVPFTIDAGTVEFFEINGLEGADTFAVTPLIGVGVRINGHPPTTAPGDTLTVDTTGLTGVVPPTDGATSGKLTATGKGDVSFVGIELFTQAATRRVNQDEQRQFAVGAGASGSAVVTVYNFDQTVAYTVDTFPGFTGGVRVADADVNGDGIVDIIAGAGPGVANVVKVYSGADKSLLATLNPFAATFTGGVYVAAGDINLDGLADVIVTPDRGGGPVVAIFLGGTFAAQGQFFGIDDAKFRGGARAAASDLDNDGRVDLIVSAGFGGGPRVAAFKGESVAAGDAKPVKFFNDFFAFENTLRNGTYVTGGDINGDGFAELIAGGGPNGGPRVLGFDGKSLVTNNGQLVTATNFFGGDVNSRGGIRVAVKDLDADALLDLVVGAGDGAGSRVTAYLGKNIQPQGTPAEFLAFDAFAGFANGVFVG